MDDVDATSDAALTVRQWVIVLALAETYPVSVGECTLCAARAPGAAVTLVEGDHEASCPWRQAVELVRDVVEEYDYDAEPVNADTTTAVWTVNPDTGDLVFGDKTMAHNAVRCALRSEDPSSGFNYLTGPAFAALVALVRDAT